MRRLGLIGGMSWESTILYYRIMNEWVRDQQGGLHSADVLLHSLEFAAIAERQKLGDWAGLAQQLGASAKSLVAAGAEAILICTNTMHKVADEVALLGGAPVLHIADFTGAALQAQGIKTAALLATRYTMEHDFIKGRLSERFDLNVIVPNEGQRGDIHRIIFEELCQGQVKPESRQTLVKMISDLHDQGAEAVILGCTELCMILDNQCSPIPTFDTTRLHAEGAMAWANAPV